MLNLFLNSYIRRLQTEQEGMSLEDALVFLELYIQYMRANPQLLESVDSQALITLTNQALVNREVPSLTLHQISSLYWIYGQIGGENSFNPTTVELIEERLSNLLRQELLI